MEEGAFILALGDPLDCVLLAAQQQLAKKDVVVHILSNLFLVNISLPLNANAMGAKIILDGTHLPIRNAKGILVSQILLGSQSVIMQASDAQYAEHEVYAAWIALLSMAPCTVINRPSARVPALSWNTTQIRSFAKSLGIPTVKEEICSRRDLVRRKHRARHLPCIDLWSQRLFYLDDDYPLESGRLYSVVEVPDNASYALTITVAEEFLAFIYKPGKGMLPAHDPLQAQLNNSSHALLCALGLSYAYCIYSLQQDAPQFTRLFTRAPAFLPSEMCKSISAQLVLNLAG
jgi:hypothetical protein